MKKITDEQRAYIIAHINDRPRVKVARDAGVSLHTVYILARRYGGEMRYDLSMRHEGIEECVRKYYPTMTAREISEKFGYSRTRIIAWARRSGVRHDVATEERIRHEQLQRLVVSRRNMDVKAAAEKRSRKRRLDELLVMSGRKPLTRLRLRAMPRKAYQARWYLERRYDYFTVEGEPYSLYYDSETRRCRNETYYTEKYGLRFIKSDEDEEKTEETAV